MKILFVVTAFYPEQAIGSVRITKFAKYLERYGDDLTILSLAPAPWSSRDESLNFPSLASMRWKIIDQSSLFRRLFLRARVKAVGSQSAVGTVKSKSSSGGTFSKVKQATQFLYTLLKAFDWMIQVRRYVKRNMSHEKFDAIFTSYPSLASPFCGLMLKRMGMSGALILDFRDPLSYGKSQGIGVKRRIQSYLVEQSSFAIFASNGVKNMILGQNENWGLGKDSIILNNGYDPDDRSLIGELHLEKNNRFKIIYTGSLYGGKRDITPLFSSIKTIIERKHYAAESIEFHYAGHEGRLFRELCCQWGFDNSIVDHGVVSRSESLALQNASDLCVVATWNTNEDQGILTGKVFEFFMLRKPVLGIVSGNLPDSEIKKVIDDVGAGFCYETMQPDRLSLLVEWLENLIDKKLKTGVVDLEYQNTVNDFSFERTVYNLRKALESSIQAPFGNKKND
ncbi:hypothetical protein J6J34_00925 [Pseudidiomarina sp. 1ASP75-14]|uniref:hypothetical protein n=1 Tax=Pseudidiomarina terrestris TaxID=2820060 RepID=UPI00264E94C9|nr:hypothetical protein [Pseudidiomarina sp. 1ASP75-14]MDN7136779.1 hypothetical protein [Pseudidiomarina sp. 1ASP75-14]